MAIASAWLAPAHATDGCKVLLCLAAPSWRRIPECVPEVHKALRDVARGRPFPRCDMAGAGNDSAHDWADPPTFCPPQYTHRTELEDRIQWSCDYAGAITTTISGNLFTRTWWNDSGDSVTDFSPAARAMLGTWDPRFEQEYAAWLAMQPPPASPPIELP